MSSIVRSPRVLTVLALGLALAGVGCSKESRSAAPATVSTSAHSDAPTMVAAATASPVSATTPGTTKPTMEARALIVTMDLALVTKDPDAVASRVRTEVERSGGFVADANVSGSADSRSVKLDLRVPPSQAKSLRASLAGMGELVQDNEKTEDVTEQRADLEARLRNARAQEKRTLEIMAQRTGSIAEVLEVERELAREREVIERYEAQKRAMDAKIDLATVHLTVSAKPAPAVAIAEPTAGAKIKHSWETGVDAGKTLALWAAMALAGSAPILVPIGILVTGIVFVVRRRRRFAYDAMAAAQAPAIVPAPAPVSEPRASAAA
jgi:hypothetical protein